MSGKARGLLAFIVVGLFALLLSVRGIANFVTDYLWFDNVGYTDVWRQVLASKVILAMIFVTFFAVLCWTNLWLADRLAPELREASPEEEAVQRFREVIGSRWGLVRFGVTGLFAISIGAGAASQWRNWLLFTNSVDFNEVDPQFGRDISFYVFRMPFLSFVADWLFTALLVVLVLTIAMHYLSGGIRIQTVNERVTPQVKAHVSVLLAAMALVRAFTYWLDRYALSYSNDGKFAGLGYTDIKARLPVLNLLILIALLSVVLFVVNIRRKGWGLPAVAVGLWALVSIVMGGIYPVAVQRFSVDPDETTKEAPYVERNIDATKNAFGLGRVDQQIFSYAEDLTGQDVATSELNVPSVPLLDPKISVQTFQLQQAERSFFQFDDNEVDVDRYVIDGVQTQVLIAARELNPSGIPESGWESEVLSFTHGNGVAVAPVNRIRDSLPTFVIGDVPLQNDIEDDILIEQPRIYFGENMDGYAIVNTDRDEIDSIDGSTRIAHNYAGEGGVAAGGFWRRSLFALRFQSIDPLISDFVRDDSRFVWNRNIGDRVKKVAPFLEFDHNPYPVVVDGRILYVVDAYTTTSNYPYAQSRENLGVPNGSGLRSEFNYVRNSVKATVDAYDGNITLYVADQDDPIILAWQKVFPTLLRPFGEMPEALLDNLRYPEDIFITQTNMWAKYHIDVDETADLLEGSDEWAVAQDPGGVLGAGQTSTTNAQGVESRAETRVNPYYSLLRLPNETKQEFVIFRSFVPFSADDQRKELQAFMVGVSEVGSQDYGRLVSFEVANVGGDEEAPGPGLVASQITSQEEVSRQISLLNARDEGSSVEFGDLIVVPIENSLIYVRPLYVIATGTRQPNLEWVIVSYADSVVMCHSMADSVRALFGVQVRGLQNDDDDPTCVGDVAFSRLSTSNAGRSDALVIGDGPAAEEALKLLDEAKEALMDGDLGRYQELVDGARGVLAADDAETDAADPESETDEASDADG
ncbi:MAG: UPF0182 family protein [Acidimicrobiales bacterium]